MVEQIFLPPQVKQSVIISNKLVYTSRFTGCRMTEEFEKNLKTLCNYYLALSPPTEIKILPALVKISRITEIELFPQCTI